MKYFHNLVLDGNWCDKKGAYISVYGMSLGLNRLKKIWKIFLSLLFLFSIKDWEHLFGVFIVFSGQYSENFAMAEVKDIMTKKVVCIKKDTPILDAIRLMSEKNITGIPVVENDMTLLGIISEQDVLRLLYTYQEEKDKIVNDFMTQPAIHFDENESLMDVCQC